jgi:hypothetical protein
MKYHRKRKHIGDGKYPFIIIHHHLSSFIIIYHHLSSSNPQNRAHSEGLSMLVDAMGT